MKANKKYAGNGIYSSTVLTSQTKTRAVARSATKKVFVRFQNDGPATDSFTVDANVTGSSSYTVQFFSGATNITAAVLAGTYQVNSLGAGLQVTIEMRITAASNTAASATANVDVFVSSNAPAVPGGRGERAHQARLTAARQAIRERAGNGPLF